MSNKPDGGPAFPVDFDHQTFRPKTNEEAKRLMSGMSMRDYFAGLAMQGLLAGNAIYGGKANTEALVADAVQHADALLAALSSTGGK